MAAATDAELHRLAADDNASPAVSGVGAKAFPLPTHPRPIAGVCDAEALALTQVRALTRAGFTDGQAGLIGGALALLHQRVSAAGCVMTGSPAVRAYLALHLAWRDREAFGCLFLDTQHAVIGGLEVLFEGTLHEAHVHPREIARRALALNARAVILVHNHPSGHARFSGADIALTRRVRQALELVEVVTLDHVLVAGARTVSAADSGLM